MGIFELLILILVLAWLFGFGFAGAALGSIVHLLLALAVILLLYRLVTGAYWRGGPP